MLFTSAIFLAAIFAECRRQWRRGLHTVITLTVFPIRMTADTPDTQQLLLVTYVYSCDVQAPLEIKIGSLDGRLPRLDYGQISSDLSLQRCACVQQYDSTHVDVKPDLFITCSVWSDGVQVGEPMCTAYKCHSNSRWAWNEWLRLPVKLCQLSRDALLALTLWDVHDNPALPHAIGATALPLFSCRGVFRRGTYDLRIWPFCEAGGQNAAEIPGKFCQHNNSSPNSSDSEEADSISDAELTTTEVDPSVDPQQQQQQQQQQPEKPVDEKPKPAKRRSAVRLLAEKRQQIAQQMRRLAKLSKNHRNGLMPSADWLDRLAFREIEHTNERHKRASRELYLLIEMPSIRVQGTPHLVVYFERFADEIHHFVPAPEVLKFYDAELDMENLVEAKHRQLTRSARTATVDKELRPAAAARAQLEEVIAAPSNQKLSQEHRDLIWKFRYYLSSNNKALGKFLQSVQWDRVNEEREALKLLSEWSPMEVEDSLQLLSAEFTHPTVRRYAVSRLATAPGGQLQLYLLQLVQALKFESTADIMSGSDESFVRSFMANDKVVTSVAPGGNGGGLRSTVGDLWQLTDFAQDAGDVLDRSVTAAAAAAADSNETSSTSLVGASIQQPVTIGASLIADSSGQPANQSQRRTRRSSLAVNPQEADKPPPAVEQADLATFLIHSACTDATLANYFYWYLKVECDSYAVATQGNTSATASDPQAVQRQAIHLMYTTVLRRLSRALFKGDAQAKRRRTQLLLQQSFVERLEQIMEAVGKEGGNRRRKTDFLHSQLALLSADANEHSTDNHTATHGGDSGGSTHEWANLNGMPHPLDPTVRVSHVLADKAILFNSALQPCKLTFRTIDSRDYVTIFKNGDDLRQDQLVIQMITLIDNLLRADNLDLRLTPYKVLATGVHSGFVQFVDSQPLSDVLRDFGTVTQFFRFYRPSNSSAFGIEQDVLDNYVRSVAGYSVVTYLLGIGDRHLHNLLLAKNGRLFHVDFGYILGRDPKPMPPPIKLTESMIEPMGGLQSPLWLKCRQFCFESFLILRRHANLILNLFALMQDTSIPDIALEPERATSKVEERFHLHLSDEEAVRLLQNVIEASLSAKMAVIADWAHDWAQALRN